MRNRKTQVKFLNWPLALLMGLLVILSAHGVAVAKGLDFSLGAPVGYSLNGSVHLGTLALEDTSAAGYVAEARAENGIGWGGSHMVVSFGSTTSIIMRINTWNLSYQMEMLGLGWSLGYGMGRSRLECSWCNQPALSTGGSSLSNEGAVQEFLLGVSIPLFSALKLDVGFRQIHTDIYFVSSGSNGGYEAGPFDFSGTAYSIGLTIPL